MIIKWIRGIHAMYTSHFLANPWDVRQLPVCHARNPPVMQLIQWIIKLDCWYYNYPHLSHISC